MNMPCLWGAFRDSGLSEPTCSPPRIAPLIHPGPCPVTAHIEAWYIINLDKLLKTCFIELDIEYCFLVPVRIREESEHTCSEIRF